MSESEVTEKKTGRKSQKNVTGVIVMAKDGRCLSRRKKWVRHRNPGAESWVHSQKAIRKAFLRNDAWTKEASHTVHAIWNCVTDSTEFIGKPIAFEQSAC